LGHQIGTLIRKNPVITHKWYRAAFADSSHFLILSLNENTPYCEQNYLTNNARQVTILCDCCRLSASITTEKKQSLNPIYTNEFRKHRNTAQHEGPGNSSSPVTE